MSTDLIEQYRLKHEQTPDYGSGKDDEHIANVIRREMGEGLKDVRSALDYGCGKSLLLYDLFSEDVVFLERYDPAIPELNSKELWNVVPGFDLITCNDVLEHIPEDELPAVLSEIRDASAGKVFFTVHCGPASHRLPNGENCHCTVKPAAWWLNLLGEYWSQQRLLWAVWPRFIVMVEGVKG